LAMAGLIREALFATRQDEPEALRYLAWGFRCYLEDDRPPGSHSTEKHPLWRLRRCRSEYGWPKTTWKGPQRPHSVISAGGGATKSRAEYRPAAATPRPAPRPVATRTSGPIDPKLAARIEVARQALREAESKTGLRRRHPAIENRDDSEDVE